MIGCSGSQREAAPSGGLIICIFPDGGYGMKTGLFRLDVEGQGEFARVHMAAGDAAPYVERDIYELLRFQPPFATLPSAAEYRRRSPARRWPLRRCDDLWMA